jgi:hypothetical protein
MIAAAGFDIIDVSYERRLYGAYTCVKTSSGKTGGGLGTGYTSASPASRGA